MRTQMIGRVTLGAALALCAGLGWGACAAPEDGEPAQQGRAAVAMGAKAPAAATSAAVTGTAPGTTASPVTPVAAWSRVLPWGTGAGQVGRRPRATEFVPEGPSAVAVGPDGAVYVLDRLNGRVLRVDRGAVAVAASVPRDAEDLAAGEGGVLAAYSPLRARVFLRETRPAADAGEVAIPRALRLARGVLLGPSRQVLVHNAHQESYRVGSPAAPRSLAAILHSKREGARLLPDGRGVAVRRHPDGRAELLVLGTGERAPVAARHALPGRVLAARVMGLAQGVACLRLERAQADHGPRISVAREVLCLEAVSGRVRLRQALALPGSSQSLPRRELALGGTPLRLAWLSPRAEGVRVELWPVPAAADAAREVRP